MEKKNQFSYWKEFFPLWGYGIKLWFGWGSWKQSMTSLIVVFGSLLAFLYLQKSDIFIDDLIHAGIAMLITFFWFIFVAVISYISANISLYKNQKEKQVSQGEEIQALKEMVENSLDIGVVPNLFLADIEVNGKNRKCLSLMVFNKSKNKKLVEFGVRIQFIFSHELVNGEILTNLSSGENSFWLEEKRELIEMRPNENANVVVGFLEDNFFGTGNFIYKGKNEIIFQLSLFFSGKYEGENHFRNYEELRAIYFSPTQEDVAFTNVAIHTLSYIDSKMVDAMQFMNAGNLYLNKQ